MTPHYHGMRRGCTLLVLAFSHGLRGRGRQCRCAEGLRRLTIDHELQVDVMVLQLRQIELIEPLAELLFQVRSVLGPNAERDDRPGVPQHCAECRAQAGACTDGLGADVCKGMS
jgi:hypothetical protein